MNIAFFIPSLNIGGAERVTALLANSFSENKMNCSIIKYSSEDSKFELNENIEVFNIDKETKSKIYGFLKRIFEIRKYSKKNQIDFLICMLPLELIVAVIATFGLSTKVIGSERSNPMIKRLNPAIEFFKKISIYLSDGYVFQTNGVKNLYSPSIQNKSVVIQNAVETKDVSKCVDINKIVCVGRLEESKGYDIAIKAFKKSLEKNPNIYMEIYGDGKLHDNLNDLINELGLSDKITLKGNVQNVGNFINNAAVFLFCSRYEGMPNALLEALSLGIPVISTDCKFGPSELIVDGYNGFLCKVDDYNEISKKMNILLSDSTVSNKFRNNAVQICKTNSPQVISQKWLDYMNKLR